LLDVFAATVARCPHRTALDAPDATLSYAELDAAAGALAARLHEHAIGRGDRVAVRVRSGSAELYVAILGVLAAGAAYVPIDADDPPARAQDIRARSLAAAEITDGLRIDPLPGEARPRPRPDRPLGGPTPGDDAWVIFTSGSTGRPKGVAVTHASASAFVDAEARLWTVEPDDRVLAGLSVGFDASCEEMWLAWRHGAALVPAPRELVRAGVELGDWLLERGITVVSTVPTLAALWDESCLNGVRLLILGGEACPEGLGWRLAAGREVWNTYGPTEATVVSTAARIVPGEPITIGWPLDGWEVAVLNGDTPAELGEPGELVIGGAGLGRYLDPVLDAERYGPIPALGWERAYRTGDIVSAGPGGLRFVGRRDDQVKIGGRRIELGEVEAALSRAPGVRAAACAVRESAAGNRLLVGYVVGEPEPDPAAVREFVAARLPAGLVPSVVVLAELPRGSSGKVDRGALPWPVAAAADAVADSALTETERWVAERFIDQLGPVAIAADSDFFGLGATSLAAAKLVSAIRERYPAIAVADLYAHPTVRALAVRLDALGAAGGAEVTPPVIPHIGWALAQVAGVLALLCLNIPGWLGGLLAVDRIYGLQPQLPWGWLIAGWLLLVSAPARSLLVLVARRVILADLRPGRYPRDGWMSLRITFVERLAAVCRLESLAGTPWAVRYARLCGHRVGADARLGTLPPVTALVTVGAGATIEADADLQGWWIEGSELVVGEVHVGAGARIATRVLLMPGAVVGEGAEVEPGSVIRGEVPAGERWAGSPAARVGRAGEDWPAQDAPHRGFPRRWRAMYALGLLFGNLLPLIAALPEVALLLWLMPASSGAGPLAERLVVLSPLLAAVFVISSALTIALTVRVVSKLIRPGWYSDTTRVGWAMWFAESLMAGARGTLFPLYASSFTRAWLRLAGVRVGPRAEVSTAAGISHLTTFHEASFAADDVVFTHARARAGWLHVAPIDVGAETFLGNGAILPDGARIGARGVIGLLTVAPRSTPDDTCWLGAPALELPRRPVAADPTRTLYPTRALRIARRGMDTVRILLPSTVSLLLGVGLFDLLEAIGRHGGVAAMAAAAPFALFAGGVAACLATAAIKWLLMGRYRPGDHPLYSFYVWRDEIVNSCQELLAGTWLLDGALGTALMPVYLRLMGAKVGRGVWVESLTITEFDLARLDDGAVVNRHAVVETHLFHDRVMSTGPAHLGRGATLGPGTAMLPDTTVGDGCVVGGRSIVMRGESLPPGTRWHGAPVVVQ
jgi:non-ribosomal peptide synthetase-like protein